MELSTIKSNITTAFTNVKERVEKNWANMSTVGKVATVATTVLLAAAAVAAAVFGHLGLAALVTLAAGIGLTISLHGAAIAGIISGVVATIGLASVAFPAATLLKTPKELMSKLNSSATAFWSSVSSALHFRK
jgi:hypothetical protein